MDRQQRLVDAAPICNTSTVSGMLPTCSGWKSL